MAKGRGGLETGPRGRARWGAFGQGRRPPAAAALQRQPQPTSLIKALSIPQPAID